MQIRSFLEAMSLANANGDSAQTMGYPTIRRGGFAAHCTSAVLSRPA